MQYLTTSEILNKFPRQALHAVELSFIHPINKKNLVLKAQIPEDLNFLLTKLDNYFD